MIKVFIVWGNDGGNRRPPRTEKNQPRYFAVRFSEWLGPGFLMVLFLFGFLVVEFLECLQPSRCKAILNKQTQIHANCLQR